MCYASFMVAACIQFSEFLIKMIITLDFFIKKIKFDIVVYARFIELFKSFLTR